MADQAERILGFHEIFRRLFSFFGQTNPRYFLVFLHRKIGPRFLSLPRIFRSAIAILVVAPAVRFFVPPVTYWPLYLLPFAPHPSFAYFERGRFTIEGYDLLPFLIFGIAFLITGVRRHLEGERLIIEGERLHSHAQGECRFFADDDSLSRNLKEPLLIFGAGAIYAYAALFTGAFHPAFGSFLIVGALDYAIHNTLITRYWRVSVQDELDAELRAESIEALREDMLGGKEDAFGQRSGRKSAGDGRFKRMDPRQAR